MQDSYAVTSVRLPGDLRARFTELAQATGRTRNELMVEAIVAYVRARDKAASERLRQSSAHSAAGLVEFPLLGRPGRKGTF